MRPSELLPLGAKVASVLRGALEHFETLSSIPPDARRPAVVLWVNGQLEQWNPMVRGITVLDGLSRAAAAEFLGGVAYTVGVELHQRGAA